MTNFPAACLFDMDELLLASVPQWRGAIDHLLNRMNARWTPELAALYQGRNARDVARIIAREIKSDVPQDECVAILRRELLRRFAHDELRPMPGAEACVRRLSARFPLAVASGSPLEAIESAMEALHIASCFGAMLSSESVGARQAAPGRFCGGGARTGRRNDALRRL